jgi:hypothetical protein
MTKVRIRQAVAQTSFPRWHFVTFAGPGGGESRGVVDLIAIRKDHSSPRDGLKRGHTFQIILIQVKGGYAARPTVEDGIRLRAVAHHHNARETLLATWKKGIAAVLFSAKPLRTDVFPSYLVHERQLHDSKLSGRVFCHRRGRQRSSFFSLNECAGSQAHFSC